MLLITKPFDRLRANGGELLLKPALQAFGKVSHQRSAKRPCR
jgi:hypothetical protein